MAKTNDPRVGSRLVQGLTELRDALAAGVELKDRFTVRTVEIRQPKEYTPAAIKALRERKLHVSQTVFARMLGMSPVLARAWEQGVRKPSGMACRLLESVDTNPEMWTKLIRIANPRKEPPLRNRRKRPATEERVGLKLM